MSFYQLAFFILLIIGYILVLGKVLRDAESKAIAKAMLNLSYGKFKQTWEYQPTIHILSDPNTSYDNLPHYLNTLGQGGWIACTSYIDLNKCLIIIWRRPKT